MALLVSCQRASAGEGQGHAMGPAAMAFIQRAFPLFVAPWEAKAKLEAAGVGSCQEVRPSTVRWPLSGLDTGDTTVHSAVRVDQTGLAGWLQWYAFGL